MKTDRYMQGILVSDEDDLFSYPKRSSRGINHMLKRLKIIKSNLVNFKYVTGHDLKNNKQAIFSKTNVEGNVENAVTDMWNRLQITPYDLED